VIDLYDRLDVWTTDETGPVDSEEVFRSRDLLKSPNRQRVRELSSNATRNKLVTVRVDEVRVTRLAVEESFRLSIRPFSERRNRSLPSGLRKRVSAA
jgi:hypothetical protein